MWARSAGHAVTRRAPTPARVAAWADAPHSRLVWLHDGVRAGAGGRGLVATGADLGARPGGEPAPAVRAARAALTTSGRSSIGADRARCGRSPVGQRRRFSCPTRFVSSVTRWRRAAFSARSRAISAVDARACVSRQRAIRHRGEQTRCDRRPVRGQPQTSHRPASGGVRTSPDAKLGLGLCGETLTEGRGRWRAGVYTGTLTHQAGPDAHRAHGRGPLGAAFH